VNNVKNKQLTNSLFAVVLLASPLVNADQKYPASDFQPEVVFQDSDYISKSSKTETVPAVAKKITKEVETTVDDPKYPAANFQPQVVYSDDNYKHNESLKASSVKAVEKVAVESSQEVAIVETAAAKKEDASMNYIIGLVGLIAVGAFLFKKQSAGSESKSSPSSTAAATVNRSASTGVARYLNKVSGTGVSRYIDKKVKTTTPATGVAKYVAKQVVAAKTTSAQAKTGVEKYMRDRG
jgi:hypothetical protein